MPAFVFPSLVIAAAGVLVLVALRLSVKGVFQNNFAPFLAILAFLVQCGCLYLGLSMSFYGFSGLWLGKLISLAGAILFICFCRGRITWSDVGLRWPQTHRFAWAFMLFVVMAAMTWSIAYFYVPKKEFSLNTFVFMLVLSGTDEELLFRGVMPALIGACGVNGWKRTANNVLAFILPTSVFMLIHALRFNGERFTFDVYTCCLVGVGGGILMSIRLTTKSLWSSIVVHNIVNAGSVVVLALSR